MRPEYFVVKPVGGSVELLELQVLHLLENVVSLGDLGPVTSRLHLLLCRSLPMLWNEYFISPIEYVDIYHSSFN